MFEQLCEIPSDINEHLPTLRDLASECTHITEMGVRKIVSTWAFLEGMKEGTLVGVDILLPEYYGGDLGRFERACKEKGIDFKFIHGNTLYIDIEETDLLFIDTLHEYAQLKKELERHSDKARKYLAFHDTISCPELMLAINELIAKGKWEVYKHNEFNNGCLILKRK